MGGEKKGRRCRGVVFFRDKGHVKKANSPFFISIPSPTRRLPFLE